jgi:hypothetical protein
MLFGNFLPSVTRPDSSRIDLLNAILLDFQSAFPDLHFELRLDRRVINAQAIVLIEKRCVLIYGGLALHPSLAEASLTFVFLHEAGHHLASGPRSPFNVTLRCDCAADLWATGAGAETLAQKTGRQLQLDQALPELDRLMKDLQNTSHSSQDCFSSCWNRRWSHRKDMIGACLARLPTNCELLRRTH